MRRSRRERPVRGDRVPNGDTLQEPIRLTKPNQEVLMRLLRRAMGRNLEDQEPTPGSPSSDQLTAIDGLIRMGMAAVPDLLRLKTIHHDDALLCAEIDEVVVRITLQHFAERTTRGDTSAIREIVSTVCNLDDERPEGNRYCLMITEGFGTLAIPELVAIAREPDHDLAVAALSFLLDIATACPDGEALLDVLPAIRQHLTSIPVIGHSLHTRGAMLDTLHEAPEMLDVLTAEFYPQLQPVLRSLDILELLCRQFPVNERISDEIRPLLTMGLSSNPAIDRFVKDKISEILGTRP